MNYNFELTKIGFRCRIGASIFKKQDKSLLNKHLNLQVRNITKHQKCYKIFNLRIEAEWWHFKF